MPNQNGNEPKPMFSWRAAVLASELDATTKHILLTLAVHMNGFGENCFPSIKRLVKETSLGRSTIITHTKIAQESGWIKKGQHGFGDQRWRTNEYYMAWPDWAQKGGPPPEPRLEEGGLFDDEGGPSGDKGGLSDSGKVVQQMDPSTSVSTSHKSSKSSSAIKDSLDGTSKPKKTADPVAVRRTMNGEFRRHARERDWEVIDPRAPEGDETELLADGLKKHGIDMVMAAFRAWLEGFDPGSGKYKVKKPLSKFLLRIDDFVEAAKIDEEYEIGAYPDAKDLLVDY